MSTNATTNVWTSFLSSTLLLERSFDNSVINFYFGSSKSQDESDIVSLFYNQRKYRWEKTKPVLDRFHYNSKTV